MDNSKFQFLNSLNDFITRKVAEAKQIRIKDYKGFLYNDHLDMFFDSWESYSVYVEEEGEIENNFLFASKKKGLSKKLILELLESDFDENSEQVCESFIDDYKEAIIEINLALSKFYQDTNDFGSYIPDYSVIVLAPGLESLEKRMVKNI